nr:hypothetical protein Iba_chr10dCG13490 [Ipomoea batatas]
MQKSSDVVAMGKFLCAGFVQIRVEGCGGNGMDSWTPFSPLGLGAFAETGGDMETDGGNVVISLLFDPKPPLVNPKAINQSKWSLTTDPKSKANSKVEVIATIMSLLKSTSSLGARVSTLCDHESPPIDLEAAIPIKGSLNANTRTKAKVITFFSPGLSPAKPRDTKN